MSLKPLGDRVLVKPVEHKKVSNGIIIPDNVKNTNLEATVVSVGEDVVSNDIKEGFNIVYTKFTGNEMVLEGQKYIILFEKDILAVIGE